MVQQKHIGGRGGGAGGNKDGGCGLNEAVMTSDRSDDKGGGWTQRMDDGGVSPPTPDVNIVIVTVNTSSKCWVHILQYFYCSKSGVILYPPSCQQMTKDIHTNNV